MSVELRIGDAERDQAMAVLREHFAQGRLTREELDERLDLAFAARTARDLTAVTADLPTDSHGPTPGRTHESSPGSGYGWAHGPAPFGPRRHGPRFGPGPGGPPWAHSGRSPWPGDGADPDGGPHDGNHSVAPWIGAWQAEAQRRGLAWPDHDPAAWHTAMRAHRREMHRIRHDMRRTRHSGPPWAHRHGPGPFLPFLLLAAVIGLIVGGFGFFKVLLALWIGAMVFRVVRKISHSRRLASSSRAGSLS